LRASAVKTNTNTLASEVDVNPCDLIRARDADAMESGQNIHEVANPNLASIGAIVAMLETFGFTTGHPAENIKEPTFEFRHFCVIRV
jgi:hypothetical protein